MYLTLEEHAKRVSELCDLHPKSAYLSTYGVYAGLLESGKDVGEYYGKNDCRVLLERLQTDNVRTEIIVGIPDYFSCKGQDPCTDCEDRYIKQLVRLLVHAERFDTFKWLYTPRNHLKCALFIYGGKTPVLKGLTGGRNLTGSDWDDVTFDMTPEQCQGMIECFAACKVKCKPVTAKTIQETIHIFRNSI